MSKVPDGVRLRGIARVVSLPVVVGYALLLATTTPFTSPANVLTGIAIVFVTALAIIRWPARPDRRAVLTEDERPPHPYLGWVVLFGVIVAWELVMYLVHGSRSAHPTLSSMADAFDRYNYFAQALACFAWLWLGFAIVRAGTPRSPRGTGRAGEAR